MREGKTKGVPVIAITIKTFLFIPFFRFTQLSVATDIRLHLVSYLVWSRHLKRFCFLIQKMSNFFSWFDFSFFPSFKEVITHVFYKKSVLLF